MNDEIPLFWSAGNETGWPQTEVLETIRKLRPGRDFLLWPWGSPFPYNSRGDDPVIVTTDPEKQQILAFSDRDWLFIPALMGEPLPRPDGYIERYGGMGDPWLMGLS